MTAPLDFDATVAILRRIHVEGEALPPLAHASGRPTGRLAAELHTFLRDLDRTVHVAERSEGAVHHTCAQGTTVEGTALVAGCTLHPRPERVVIPARASPYSIQGDARGRTIRLDVHGRQIGFVDPEPVEAEQPEDRMVPRRAPT